MTSRLLRDRVGAAPYIQPMLEALDRMQHRVALRPDAQTARAEALLNDRLGTAPARPEAAFAHGDTGLLGEHTHYFDGFAVLLSLPMGTAVAVRERSDGASRLVFDGNATCWTFGGEAAEGGPAMPVWARLVACVVRRLAPAEGAFDVAVVSTVTASCLDAYLAALGVATARALQAALALPESSQSLLRHVRDCIEETAACPFSLSYVIAADVGRPDALSLVDTATRERLPLEAGSRETLGWGLVDLAEPATDPTFFRDRQDQADEALALLKRRGFAQLETLRGLEHRDLERALAEVPRRLRPVLRHLVAENRRVVRLVAAVRQRDWQMVGALMLMSHASQRDDWGSTSEAADAVVEQVEAMSIEGMYGAAMTGRGSCVLMVGQPFVVPRCLDRVQAVVNERFGYTPDTLLL